MHTLRQIIATINIKNDISVEIIQGILCHSTISTTFDIYSHVDLEMQEEAANKLDKAVDIE